MVGVLRISYSPVDSLVSNAGTEPYSINEGTKLGSVFSVWLPVFINLVDS